MKKYLVGLIALLSGVLFFVLRLLQRSKVDAVVAETKGRDQELKKQQLTLQEAVKQIDQGIEQAKAEREAQRIKDENMTLKERADRIKKGLS